MDDNIPYKNLSDKFDYLFNKYLSSDTLNIDTSVKIDIKSTSLYSNDFLASLNYDNILFSSDKPSFLLSYSASDNTPFIDFILPKFKIRSIIDLKNELLKLIYIYKRNPSHAQYMFNEILYNLSPNKYIHIFSFINTNHECAPFFLDCLLTFYNKIKYMQDNFIQKYNKYTCSSIISSLDYNGLHTIYDIWHKNN